MFKRKVEKEIQQELKNLKTIVHTAQSMVDNLNEIQNVLMKHEDDINFLGTKTFEHREALVLHNDLLQEMIKKDEKKKDVNDVMVG